MLERFVPSSEFAKNVFKLAAGSSIAQAITFLTTIFLARIYLPQHFGSFSLYVSILSFLLVFSTGKYDLAIVVSRKEETTHVISLSFFVSLLFAMLVLITVVCIHISHVSLFKDSEVSGFYYFLPLSVIFLSGVQIFWMWYVRIKRFAILSYVRVIEALLIGVLAFLLKDYHGLGLLLANLLANFVSFTILGYFYLKDQTGSIKAKPATLKEMALKHSEFPKLNIVQNFLEIFQFYSITLIGSRFFGIEVIGYYAFCLRILQAPMGLIIKPVANVFFSEASERYRLGQELHSLAVSTIRKTALFISPVILAIIVAGPFLFSLFFGPNWHEAGIYARILAVWIALDLIRSPVSQISIITGNQREIVKFSLAGNILLTITLLTCGTLIKEPRITFLIISAVQSIFTIILIILQIRLAKGKTRLHPDSL